MIKHWPELVGGFLGGVTAMSVFLMIWHWHPTWLKVHRT